MTKRVRASSALVVFCGSAVAALIATATDAAPLAAEVSNNASAAQDGSASGGTPQTDPSSSTLQEVVVTAEKRSETAQKAPVAITAVSGETMVQNGVTNARGLENLVPGLAIRPEGAVSQAFVRGVGNNVDVPYAEPGVGYNLNGVYLPRYASTSSFFDLAGVEVLPGPQGTLYGGSSAGGVININTVRPRGDFDGVAIVEGGNYGLIHAFVAQDMRIGDSLGVRAAVDYVRHDGYQSNGGDSLDTIAGRISALYNPTDRASLFVWVNAFHDGGKPADTVNSPLLKPSDPWFVPATNPVIPSVQVTTSSTFEDFNNVISGAQFDLDLGGVSLRNTAGAVYVDDLSNRWAGYLPQILGDREHQYSDELVFSNTGTSPLQWLVGAYANTDDINFHINYASKPILTINRQQNISYGAFGQATYSVLNWLRVTAGGRYSEDQKNARGTGVGLTGLEPFAATPSWGHFDWKLGVEADVTSRSLLYATVQTGYLPGGYSPNPSTATFNNTIAPETLLSYTAGSKNLFFDDRLELNNEIYYYNYKNYIVQVINLVNGTTSVYNAPVAIIYGDQLNIKWKIDQDSEIDLGANLMSARFDRFVLNGVNYHGFQLPDAPSVVVGAGGQHTFTLPGEATLVGRVDTHFEDGHWGQFDHNPGTHQVAYTKTDLTLTYYPASGPWSIAIWAKNLENSAVFGATATSPTPGPSAVFIDPPRTFGVRVATKW